MVQILSSGQENNLGRMSLTLPSDEFYSFFTEECIVGNNNNQLKNMPKIEHVSDKISSLPNIMFSKPYYTLYRVPRLNERRRKNMHLSREGGGLQVVVFCLVVELALGLSDTNGDTTSSFCEQH